MNSKISFLTTTFVVLLSQFIFAQNATDALRYSQLAGGGTARFIGVAGSMGALGTDYGTLSTNPAGLAMYRKSEFVITPHFSSNKSLATLAGNNNSFSYKTNKFSLSNVGILFYSRPRRALNWKAFNFGVGYNRLADFNNRIVYEGATSGSLAQSFAESANGFASDELDPFGTQMAYQTGAIYDFSGTRTYATDFDDIGDTPVFRTENYETTGGINELVFSFAGNYNNRLMLGATVGVPLLSWELDRQYREDDNTDDAVPYFRSLSYQEEIRTEGIGINAKIGLIYRVNQMLRLGAAVHTPTTYSMTDNYEFGMTYDFIDSNTEGPFATQSPEGSFNYRLRTPWKYQVSGAVLIKKLGFVSAEIEYVDFGSPTFDYTKDNRSNDFSAQEQAVNRSIAESYQSVLNFKLGAEYVYKIFQFRAGYAINGSPFAEEKDTNQAVSVGLGLRKERFYIDAAYRRPVLERTYRPYTSSNASQPIVNTTQTKNDFVLTVGLRF